MKHFDLQSVYCRKSSLLVLPLLFLLGNFFSSCEDDLNHQASSLYVSFSPKINSSWTQPSRSVAENDVLHSTVTSLQGGDTPLYLHTICTDSMSFSPSVDRHEIASSTRAAAIENENMYDCFGVSAYVYTDTWNESKTPDYFYNVAAAKSGDGYRLSSDYYWPGKSYKVRFFAYAPMDNENYILSGRNYAGSPNISVTIPNDVEDQKDLLVAKTDEFVGGNNAPVSLAFNHALTAVKFVCGDDMQEGVIKSISLKNVYSKGIYNMGTRSWNSVGNPVTFSQTLNRPVTGGANEDMTNEAQTFMMIPQTLSEGAALEILFTDKAGSDHVLSADLKGTVWTIGQTVTYKISTSSINWSHTFVLTPPDDFSYAGGTLQYGITSYRENNQGDKENISWTSEYSLDGGVTWSKNKPSWLTSFTENGEGGSVRLYEITVAPQTGIEKNLHTEILRKAPFKGSETIPYNLANQTNGNSLNENTANCYVVNSPGCYSFPLVYGNAIKNGQKNPSAYSYNSSNDFMLNSFVNHAGVGITDPYIVNNGCTPVKAELIWQDAKNLISEVKYNRGLNGGYISFRVDKASIRQGNAVIAVKDANNQVLWSWHIWVTDEDISQTVPFSAPDVYNFMPVDLGWCHGTTVNYTDRHCLVKIMSGRKQQTMVIRQTAQSVITGGNSLYYQWGRKDPFQPSNGISNIYKTWYDKDNIAHTESPETKDLSTGIEGIKNWILNPNVMQNKLANYDKYQNLWNMKEYDSWYRVDRTIKTIYDPCPVGFSVPVFSALYGLTHFSDAFPGNSNDVVVVSNTVETQQCSFTFLGYIDPIDGTLQNVGTTYLCWGSTPVPALGQAVAFSIEYWGNFDVMGSFTMYSGCVIRPCRGE